MSVHVHMQIHVQIFCCLKSLYWSSSCFEIDFVLEAMSIFGLPVEPGMCKELYLARQSAEHVQADRSRVSTAVRQTQDDSRTDGPNTSSRILCCVTPRFHPTSRNIFLGCSPLRDFIGMPAGLRNDHGIARLLLGVSEI